MRANQKALEKPQFLCGWKDIANYMGKGVRTLQRYERFLGLPVRRPAGKPRGSVVATRAEIDAWVAASPIRGALYLSAPRRDPAAFTAAMKEGIAEMTRLRDQMTMLRLEVSQSVRVLHESIESVRGEMTNNWRRQSALAGLLLPIRGLPNLTEAGVRSKAPNASARLAPHRPQ